MKQEESRVRLLTPGNVLNAIGGIDAEVRGEWRVHDVRWAHERQRIDVELQRSGDRFIATICDSTEGPQKVNFGYTNWGMTKLAVGEKPIQISMRLFAPLLPYAEYLKLAPNDGRMSKGVMKHVSKWTKVPWRDGTKEWEFLGESAVRYEEVFGVKVQCLESAEGDMSLCFPVANIIPSASVRRWSVPFRVHMHRTLRKYFAELGFGVDERGEMNIVPTLDTLRKRVKYQGNNVSPFSIELQSFSGKFHKSKWAQSWLDFKLPIGVSNEMIGLYVHDVGYHWALFHRIRDEQWKELLGILEERVSRRPETGYLNCAVFIEGTMSQACEQCWERVVEPSDFDREFENCFDELILQARELDQGGS